MSETTPGADNPVFYDATGRRWKRTKIVAFVIFVTLMGFTLWITPHILALERVVFFRDTPIAQMAVTSPFQNRPPDVAALSAQLLSSNPAILGSGPLVRVVSIQQGNSGHVAIDPFSGRIVGPVSDAEVAYVDTDSYALQRYGQTDGRRIALTFDDGPHPIYTPQLLDILSKNEAKATFFVTGDNVARYPEIAERIVREGHTIANHSFTHANFDFISRFQAQQELNVTGRVITAATERRTAYFRPPYGGDTDQSLRNSIAAILTAQQLGYVVASYDFDSNDWRFPDGYQRTFPTLNGRDRVVLVHDGGGNRETTVAYVQQMIDQAKRQNYTFASLEDLYPQSPALVATTTPTPADIVTMAAAQSALVWPQAAITALFTFSVMSIMFTTLLNVSLAIFQHKYRRPGKRRPGYAPRVTVLVPAYNEGVVIVRTVEALKRSRYRNVDIVIIDDGSTDDTWSVAQGLAQRFSRVTAIRQDNAGKAAALNRGIAEARGSILIGVDADTIFPPETISRFVRHFSDPTVGAVAGVVKVGNVSSALTLWQAMEYSVSIAVERNAHALLGSIMIVPGACGAWRKSAVLEAGGLSHSTLAEDCDLTVKIQQLRRYRVLQDNEAIAYTEAPQKFHSLVKQRFRWTFGNIQALWKYRHMALRHEYGWLGMWVMPYAIVSIMIPLLFWPLLMIIGISNVLAGNYIIILIYFAVSMTLQFIVAAIGLKLAKESMMYLVVVPFARFIYGPIRTYVLYKTIVVALRGSYVGWSKLVRTGSVSYGLSPKVAPSKVVVNR